jgi:ketosteroid isomerase-like protein
MQMDIETVAETIVSLERQALERWNNGDVEGQLKFYAEDVTYFDPITATRLDGWPAVADYFRAVWAGKVKIPRYEMINPRVVAGTDLAVLSYNLVNYFPGPDGSETVGTRWNSTQVYRRTGDHWRVVHVHWSFTKHPASDNMAVQG